MSSSAERANARGQVRNPDLTLVAIRNGARLFRDTYSVGRQLETSVVVPAGGCKSNER